MNKTKLFIILISSIFLLYLSFYIYKWEYRKPVLDMYLFSLNKGRAIFVRTPQNKTILIGAGKNSEIIREITKITPFYSRKIDMIVIPSAVSTQIGGFIDILNRYEIGELIMPEVIATSTVLDELIKKAKKEKIKIKEIKKDDEIIIDKETMIKILFPYKDFKFNKTSLPELGMAVSYSSTTVYLLGNLSKTIQKDIAGQLEVKTDQNLVEFYNSGGDTKISIELINKIKPKFTFTTKEKTAHFVSNGLFFLEI